jgi:hypothetical protein
MRISLGVYRNQTNEIARSLSARPPIPTLALHLIQPQQHQPHPPDRVLTVQGPLNRTNAIIFSFANTAR